MGDILINCPCESHKLEKTNRVNKVIKPAPKILFIASKGSVGKFKIQCSDTSCRKYNRESSNGKYNSWYEIELNANGSSFVKPLPKQFFELEKMPFVVYGEDECRQQSQKDQQSQ